MNTSTQPHIQAIEIIYEDELMVVVNKPNNFLVHSSHYARNIRETTLLEFLKDQLGYHVYPVHRLDRKTSGIILLLKNKEFVAQFQELFTSKSIVKTYYAILRGLTKSSGIIDSPIKNDESGIYKDALTHYENLATIELDIPVHPYDKSRYSLVKFLPQTGRMHQLRKHANKISHPIVGDYKYGDRFHNRMFESEFRCEYLFLHAYSLDFIHPINKENCHFEAKFPFDWHRIFDEFNWTSP